MGIIFYFFWELFFYFGFCFCFCFCFCFLLLLLLLLLLLFLLLLLLLLQLLFLLLLLLLLAFVTFAAFYSCSTFLLLYLHVFRSSCCLVASCEFVAAFAACVVIISLKLLCFCFLFWCSFQISSTQEAPVPLSTRHQKIVKNKDISNRKTYEFL